MVNFRNQSGKNVVVIAPSPAMLKVIKESKSIWSPNQLTENIPHTLRIINEQSTEDEPMAVN